MSLLFEISDNQSSEKLCAIGEVAKNCLKVAVKIPLVKYIHKNISKY